MDRISVASLLGAAVALVGLWLVVSADGYVGETFTLVIGLVVGVLGVVSLFSDNRRR